MIGSVVPKHAICDVMVTGYVVVPAGPAAPAPTDSVFTGVIRGRVAVGVDVPLHGTIE
jgi:hypothetical protein